MKERLLGILDYITEKGDVSIDEIINRFHYSRSTVRRDIIELERMGAVTRSRGTVSAVIATTKEKHYLLRKEENIAGKEKIASLCLNLLAEHKSVFIDGGTTSLALCRLIPYSYKLTVITNGLENACVLLDKDMEDVIVAGGYTRQGSSALVGEATVDFIKQFYADYCIISSYGVDENEVYEASMQQSYVKKAMLSNSRVKILLCDSTKFDRIYKYRLAGLSEFDYVICDKKPNDKYFSENPLVKFIYP